MILLLGGTSETAKVAQALAEAGREVLVSTATDVFLEVGTHRNIRRRQGRLDELAMKELIMRENISVVVDAAHPYAEALHSTARKAVSGTKARYFAFMRPGGSFAGDEILCVPDHETAARAACAPGKPVLLTIGSRFARVYATEALAKGIPLFARVLAHADSVTVCCDAGIPLGNIIVGRGPFTVDENRELIRRFKIGVVVTKDSGDAGGFAAKVESARQESCRLIVVERNPVPAENCFDRVESLVQAVLEYMEKSE